MRALSLGAVEGVAQDEEPAERCGAQGGRGSVALILHREKQDDGQHSDAEEYRGEPGCLDDEIPS